jgi:MoxR-like ATPase
VFEYVSYAQAALNEVNKAILGKSEEIREIMTAFLAGGHVLMEDIPGVGKTTLASAFAAAMGLEKKRVQFTPDVMPSDLTGFSIYRRDEDKFVFQEGSVFTNLLLADEINRTSPKTQAALLEAMAEGQVSVDGHKHQLPRPFMVIATQNPIEFLGTYPLPEAQLDRFMMKLSIGYLDKDEEIRLGKDFLNGKTAETPPPVCKGEDIITLQKKTEEVHVSDSLLEYVQKIIAATRENENFVLGASPRAMLVLIRAAQARALIEERDFVKPDDVRKVAINVLHHRLVLTSEARILKKNVDSLLSKIISSIDIPLE